MNEPIKEQLEKAAAKKESGDGSGLPEMIEKAAAREGSETETSEEVQEENVPATENEQPETIDPKQAAENILTDRILTAYVDSHAPSQRKERRKKIEGYRKELTKELKRKQEKEGLNLGDKSAVKEAVVGFLRSKRLTKVIEILEQGPATPENDPAGEGSKMEVPKSVEEFEARGFKISTETEKYYYTSEESAVDIEIIDFDESSGEVTVVFHQEAKIVAQEEGQNVIDFQGDKQIQGKRMPYQEFAEMMKSYTPLGLEEGATKKEGDEKKAEGEKTFKIIPGKLFRNDKGEKIKIVDRNPVIKDQVRTDLVRVRFDVPGEKRRYKNIKVEELKSILHEGKYREVNTSIKIRKGAIWQKGDQKIKILRHEGDGEKSPHIVVFRDQNDEGSSMPLNDLKEKIDSEGWTEVEAPKSKRRKSGREKPEQAVESKLEEQETRAIEKVFVPYAQEYLEGVENFQWGEGYTAAQVAELKSIERERFFAVVAKQKISETNFIREEVIDIVVEEIRKKAEELVPVKIEQTETSSEDVAEDEQVEKAESPDEKEIQTIKTVFVPYAQKYLQDLEAFDWGENFPENLAARRKQVEEDKFWGSVLPLKMKETKFIRGEALFAAVELTKEKLESEPNSDQST